MNGERTAMQWSADESRFWSPELNRWVPVIRGGDEEPSLTADEQKLANKLMGMLRNELIKPLTDKLAKVESAQKDSATKADGVLAKLEEELSGTLKALGIDEDEETGGGDEDEGGETEVTGTEGDQNLEGRLAFMSRRYEKRIAALEKNLSDKERIAKESEERRRLSDRDKMLTQALQQIKANDPRKVVKLLQDNVRWDEDRQLHVFVTTEGAEFPMTEEKFDDFAVAVREELPAWSLQAAATAGGSGSASPRIADRLTHAKQSIEEARAKAAKDPRSDAALGGILKAKREAKQVEAEAAAGRGGTRS